MSDSFADLWSSTAPNSKKQQQTLNSLSNSNPSNTNTNTKTKDLFSLLAAPAQNRSSSSSIKSTSTPPPTSLSKTKPSSSTGGRTAGGGGGDAFSDLLTPFSSQSQSQNKNLTIAQREELARQQRLDAHVRNSNSNSNSRNQQHDAWVGLDSLGGGFSGYRSNLTTSTENEVYGKGRVALDDFFGLGDLGGSGSGSGLSSSTQETVASAAARAARAERTKADTVAALLQDDNWNFEPDFIGSSSKPPSYTSSTTNAATTTTTTTTAATSTKATSKSKSKTKSKSNQSKNLWDLDEFQPSPGQEWEEPLDSISDNFDFGHREDGLLSKASGKSYAEDDDDFMSVFNRPAQPQPSSKKTKTKTKTPSPNPASPRQTTSSRRGDASRTGTGTVSPPPHILGQIIEMGFSIPKAKKALAETGGDVQAALELLLGSEGLPGSGRETPQRQTDNNSSSPLPPPHSTTTTISTIHRRKDRDIQRDRQREHDSNSPTTGSGDLQTQAEQLLAQASELGRGMFTKASLFWKEKKEQVQKVVEEQVASRNQNQGGSNGSSRQNSRQNTGAGIGTGGGRPKWMQDALDKENEQESPVRVTGKGSFRDNGDDEREREQEVKIPRRLDRQRDRERERDRELLQRESEQIQVQQQQEEPVDLFAFSDDTPTQPQSTFQPRSQVKLQPPKSTGNSLRPKFERIATPVPEQIASLKASANQTFKLGQFGEAETLYTRAISSLTSSSSSSQNKTHVYFIPLYNNRANARMKIGDISGALKDCENVISIIVLNELGGLDSSGNGGRVDEFDSLSKSSDESEIKIDWDPSSEYQVSIPILISSSSTQQESETIDLAESLTKAIKRRAEAFESIEKWGKAKKSWEFLLSGGSGSNWVRESVKSEAGRGVSRCGRMLGESGVGSGSGFASGITSSISTSIPKPTPKPKPRAPIPVPTIQHKSEALESLRNTTALQEAEDLEKDALKDTVDTKLNNWKHSKESNIRALLASLDTILWPELVKGGGTKVGLHELVTPSQVKVRYMKAVAKVHPDKLNASNSTVEQRMIAQGVFAALNEAWNAFKQ